MKILIDADGCPVLDTAVRMAKKIRSSAGRLKGPPKRTTAQDKAFSAKLASLLGMGRNHTSLK